MTARPVQQNNVIGQNCCKQFRNDQWCNGNLVFSKNTHVHDSLVSDITGNIYSQMSFESLRRKYYLMKPL